MPPVNTSEDKPSTAIVAMYMLSIMSAIVVSLSFIVIRYWPQPPSVAPYFGGRVGLVWGLVCGAIFGLILGYLTDDRHFAKPE